MTGAERHARETAACTSLGRPLADAADILGRLARAEPGPHGRQGLAQEALDALAAVQ
ncbi:MAG: hypothetical protein AAFQ43_01480 [Bacteroidota bacterium]